MPGFCRDCLADAPQPRGRCAACGSPRVVAHAEIATLTIAHVDCDAPAKGRDRTLGMIPCRRRLADDGRAVCVQSGEQDRAFHLGARRVGLVRNGVQSCAVDRQRRAGTAGGP